MCVQHIALSLTVNLLVAGPNSALHFWASRACWRALASASLPLAVVAGTQGVHKAGAPQSRGARVWPLH